MSDLLQEAANPSHAHMPLTLTSTQSQLRLPANPHARSTPRRQCYSHCLVPASVRRPSLRPLCCWPQSMGPAWVPGEAKPSHPLQGLETGGSLRSEAHARRAGGVRVSVCCGRCDPGTRSPGGTEHWPAWPPSAAHSTSPQTRRPRWRSAADRREACCHHGPQDQVGGCRGGGPSTGCLCPQGGPGNLLEDAQERRRLSTYCRPRGRVHTFQDGGVPPQSQDVSIHHLLLGDLCTPISPKAPSPISST